MAVSVLIPIMLGCDKQLKSADRNMQHFCQKNLQQLYLAIQQYAKGNQNRLPNDWAALVQSGAIQLPTNHKDENPLVCPGSALTSRDLPASNQEWLSWIQRDDVSYVLTAGGKQLTANKRDVIVVEKAGDHLDCGFVLFSDGSIEQRNDQELAKLQMPR